MRKHRKDNQLIDLIKIIVKDFPPFKLENNPLLNFYGTINPATGEVKTVNRHGQRTTPFTFAMYNGLEFRIYDTGTIKIIGSLHKYWNDGDHNYNDFTSDAISSVLQDLKLKFDINPSQCILKGLEIGINIVPPIPTNQILDNCFLHKTTAFEYRYNSEKGKYKQVQHSQYIIKIYNKALQYKNEGFATNGEILRYEIKYTKMAKLNRMGIFTLQDLISFGVQNFETVLLQEWDNVFYYDNTIQIDPFSVKNRNAIRDYSNPNYWNGLLSNKQSKNFTYHKNQLKKFIRNGSKKIHRNIAEIISKKIAELNANTIQIDPLTILSKWIVPPNTKPNTAVQNFTSFLL